MVVKSFSPIAIFAYRRQRALDAMLESLMRCPEFVDSPVTIFIDGPKGPNDAIDVQQVRDLALGIRLPNVSVEISDTNKGLKRSIFAGVSSICARYGRVIVLEDDLILAPSALTYFNAGIERYKDTQAIWAIEGYMYDVKALRRDTRALILPFAHPWGWATWKRAWDQFSLDIEIEERDLKSQAFVNAFDMNGLYRFSRLLELNKIGKVDSWFALWYYTIFKNGGRSIFPPSRVVENRGLSAGAHGTVLNPQNLLVRRPKLMAAGFVFPDRLDVDFWALDHMKACPELRVQRLIAWAGYMKRMHRR